MTKEQRKKKAWIKYHFGNGDLTFAQYHNQLTALYDKNGVQ